MFSPKQLAVMKVLFRHQGGMNEADIQKAVGCEIGRSDLFPCLKYLERGGHVETFLGANQERFHRITKIGERDLQIQDPQIFALIPEVV
jgi:hypothetical protein